MHHSIVRFDSILKIIFYYFFYCIKVLHCMLKQRPLAEIFASGRCLGSKVEALKMSVPSSMKALVKQEAGLSYTYTDVSVVPPQGDELLVKVGKVALCGSDISLYQWNNGELDGVTRDDGSARSCLPLFAICSSCPLLDEACDLAKSLVFKLCSFLAPPPE